MALYVVKSANWNYISWNSLMYGPGKKAQEKSAGALKGK